MKQNRYPRKEWQAFSIPLPAGMMTVILPPVMTEADIEFMQQGINHLIEIFRYDNVEAEKTYDIEVPPPFEESTA